ncbi:MAG: pirin family protein [Bacteroidia bacterium]|nr:pirin family protein [Bacteroidia bacterium]
MSNIRKIRQIFNSTPVLEGAGVHLNRVFGNSHVSLFDPFLLLDDFSSDDPGKYLAGFPWHPHRGIETVTFILEGEVEHMDSLGNEGVISGGDVQWMTAGSGIIHQEMPHGDVSGKLVGLQLWVNLPASHKMMMPRYRDVKSGDIPRIEISPGIEVRIICGTMNGTDGPVKDIVTEIEYMYFTMNQGSDYTYKLKPGHTVFAYLTEGQCYFDENKAQSIRKGQLALFSDGENIRMKSDQSGVSFILLSGRPLNEPVAWRGPIVMNTDNELRIAFTEYNNGTFLKHRKDNSQV